MAKSKTNRTSLILGMIAIVLCLVTAISFFIPTYRGTSDDTVLKYSSMEICFISEETAREKAQEAGIVNAGEALRYTTLASYKANEDASGALNASGWMHFFAMIASVIAIVFIILCLAGKRFSLVAINAVLASLAFMIASLISALSFLNVEVIGGAIKDTLSINAGIILGLVTSIIASITVLLKINGKRAV